MRYIVVEVTKEVGGGERFRSLRRLVTDRLDAAYSLACDYARIFINCEFRVMDLEEETMLTLTDIRERSDTSKPM